MDLHLIRAYCTKDLSGILKKQDVFSTPASRFDELQHRILLKHMQGIQVLEPRQYAAALCLLAVEALQAPFLSDEKDPEWTADSKEATGRQMVTKAWSEYLSHLPESEAAPLRLINDFQKVKTSRVRAFDLALPYLQKVFSSGKFAITKEFIRELKNQSANTDSPFKEANRTDQAFFLKDGGKSISHSVIEDRMKEIRNPN